jgi:hypothetical protein
MAEQRLNCKVTTSVDARESDESPTLQDGPRFGARISASIEFDNIKRSDFDAINAVSFKHAGEMTATVAQRFGIPVASPAVPAVVSDIVN